MVTTSSRSTGPRATPAAPAQAGLLEAVPFACALFGADGTPILLTDNRSSTFFKAAEDDLRTVSLH